jgi:DNA-binding NarL/FixJ family response regulator
VCKPVFNCVLLAERHHGLTEGIRGLLETAFEAVIMVADPNSMFEGVQRLQPALVVMELSLIRNGGLQLLRTLRSSCPAMKVIVLSMHDDPAVVRSVLEAGVDGYVLKRAIATDLLPAVDSVLAGNCYVSSVVPMQALE